MADLVEIAAGVMLRPKLVGEIVGKILKSRKSWIKIHGFGHQRAQIMNFAQLPAASNQVSLKTEMNLNRRKQREQRFKSLSLKLTPADSTLAGEAIHVWLPLILCFLCFLLFIHLPF